MGNTASGQSARPAKTEDPKKEATCYYDLLGISSVASAEELKRAYRQKALQLHPDKNTHRITEATAEFASIQHAYQTLSDPHERAWYDRHRESILGVHKKSDEDAPGVEELMKFFDIKAFGKFDDGPNGFYSVYRQVFSTIEEYEVEEAGSDYERDELPTSFGSMNTPYEPMLKIFYDKWLGFVSKRAFDHVDQYQTEYGENRRVRRAMAKENQKLRDQHKREFSETVRNLAAFVRKRDPRFKAHEKERGERRKEKASEIKQKIKIARAEATAQYEEPDWSKVDLLNERLESMLKTGSYTESADDDSEEIAVQGYYCAPCKKTFKSSKQWKNHANSKKHMTRLDELGLTPEELGIDDPSDSEDEIVEIVDDAQLEEERYATGASSLLPDQSPSPKETKPRESKARQKPRRRKEKKTSASENANVLACKVCHVEFPSRNRLFQHIHQSNHASAP